MNALAEFAERKLLPLECLERWHVEDEPGGGIRFEYGNDARARIRKTVASAHPTYWARGDTRPMRALGHHLAGRFAKRAGKTVLISEGESDTFTLWLHRRPGLGVPGATMAHVIAYDDVSWAERAIIVREPGDAGAQFISLVARRLRDIGFAGDIFEISLAPHKDVSALHLAVAGDSERFTQALDASIARAAVVEVPPDNGATCQTGDVLTFDDLARKCTEQIDWFIEGLVRGSGILLVAS